MADLVKLGLIAGGAYLLYWLATEPDEDSAPVRKSTLATSDWKGLPGIEEVEGARVKRINWLQGAGYDVPSDAIWDEIVEAEQQAKTEHGARWWAEEDDREASKYYELQKNRSKRGRRRH